MRTCWIALIVVVGLLVSGCGGDGGNNHSGSRSQTVPDGVDLTRMELSPNAARLPKPDNSLAGLRPPSY